LSTPFSHRLREKHEFQGSLKGVLSELSFNEAVLREIQRSIVEELKALEERKMLLSPLPLLRTSAFTNLMLWGTYLKVPEHLRYELEEAYVLFSLLNECAQRYERLKFGIERAMSGSTDLVRLNGRLILEYAKMAEDKTRKIQSHLEEITK